ncbi:MAG: hypothetical protein HC902_14955, partial [Calothrix sp. SM1_5_4]|nr:hypothetical protein [Calothrix sp. SM1_5_4]
QTAARGKEAQRLDSDIETKRASILEFNRELTGLRTEIDRLQKERQATQAKAKEAQEQLGHLTGEIRAVADRTKAAQADADKQILELKTKVEDAKVKFAKEEETRLEELRLQTARKLGEIERRMLEELDDKKETLSRELLLTIETYLKENPEASGGGGRLNPLQGVILKHLDEKIPMLAKEGADTAKRTTMVSLKRREKWRAGFTGAVIGVLLVFGGLRSYRHLRQEASPMQQRVLAAQEERRLEMEKRKFNPPQTRDFKATYVDNVVYTENFVTTYTSDEFQKRFLQALTPYMLKTWKIEEEQVIQLLAATNALVKGLAEKKEGIHPDFVPQGIQKMKDTESEAVVRIRQLLGSQVRVESFHKFQKQFYENYTPK